MPRDPARVDAQLVASVRDCTDGADETEIRAALSTLSPAEEKRLQRLLRDPPRSHLSPFAWADLARGTDPQIAAARELSGYYALQMERDALAALVSAARPQPPVGQERRARTRAPKSKPATTERAQELLGLFAYHRDAPLVARSLGVPLAALAAELEALGIRRKAYRIARGTGAQMPLAKAAAGPGGAPVRRRTRTPAPPPPPTPEEPRSLSEQQTLKVLLAEVGPRRALLGERLDVSGGALLARLRAAGLEREFALRERDLIRALCPSTAAPKPGSRPSCAPPRRSCGRSPSNAASPANWTPCGTACAGRRCGAAGPRSGSSSCCTAATSCASWGSWKGWSARWR